MDSFANLGNTMLLKDRVYKALKTEIILGRFKAGQRLNMLELASTMNISSAPIREALNMLCKDGFVVLNPRKQAIVAQASWDDWKVLTDLRKMLEPYAAQLSAPNVPPEVVVQLREQLLAVEAAPENIYAYVESDVALHEILHLYAGSKVLSDILTTIKEHSMRMRYHVERFDDPESGAKIQTTLLSTKEHLAILDAIAAHDAQQVYSTVLHHIDNYMERTKSGEE